MLKLTCSVLALSVLALITSCAGPKPEPSGSTDIDVSQGQLESMRIRAEGLARRCSREADGQEAQAGKLRKCRDLYEALLADANSYWTLYKKSFVAPPLRERLTADLEYQAKEANRRFVELRDFVVPVEEQVQGDPATIIAIIEIGTTLYNAYAAAKRGQEEQVKKDIFEAIDASMFRSWDMVVAPPA